MPESVSILLALLMFGFSIFVVIRAFRRGYGGWGWGIIAMFVIVPVSTNFVPDPESILFGFLPLVY